MGLQILQCRQRPALILKDNLRVRILLSQWAMNNEELLQADVLAVSHPDLIPGVYNYCDRWCDRCRFNLRCSVFRQTCGSQPTDESPELEQVQAGFEQATKLIEAAAEHFGFDLSMTEEESEALMREEDERAERARADPLAKRAREYFEAASPIVNALRPVLAERGDQIASVALETVGALMGGVMSKTRRAVRGQLDPAMDDTDDLQNDTNGSAKIARILVADSRRAWRVLMEAGRATADGVPARLVETLDEIEASLAQRFPDAMRFVRPGFDTEWKPASS